MAVEKHITPAPDYTQGRSSEQFVPEAETWIPGNVQDSLNSEVYPDKDVLFGWGEAHEYGQIGECRLGLYPEYQTLVYEDPQVYLVIKKPSRVTRTEVAVFVDTPGETQSSFFAFERDGGMNLVVKPKQLALDRLDGGDQSADFSQPFPVSTVEPIMEAPTETLVSEVTAPWEVEGSGSSSRAPEVHDNKAGVIGANPIRSSEPQTPAAVSGKEKQKPKRVDLKAARLGRPIVCRKTQREKTITKFPVAEHSKDGEGNDVTAWHTVMAFNALADRLCREFDAGEIAVGEELKVAGYPQIQVIPDRNGELKQHEVVFAAHVGKVKKGGQ